MVRRAHSEGLESRHILLKRDKWGSSRLVPKERKALACGGWPSKTRLRPPPRSSPQGPEADAGPQRLYAFASC